MRTPGSLTPILGPATLIAGLTYLLVAGLTLAHDGEVHDQSGGMSGNVIDIVATAAALVIVYTLATWFFRSRDRASTGNPPPGPGPGQILASPRSPDRHDS